MRTSESSFGLPYKLSVTRVLASDLRTALKEGNADQWINDEYWTSDLFMHTYLTNPALLLKPAALLLNSNSSAYTSAASLPAWAYNDSANWTAQPWVFCPDNTALKTRQGCLGTIDRQTWIHHKSTMCPHMVKTYMQSSRF